MEGNLIDNLRARRLEVVEVPEATVITEEELDMLLAAMLEANGYHHGSMVDVDLKYVSEDQMPIIPVVLQVLSAPQPTVVNTLYDEKALSHQEYSEFGVRGGALWAPPADAEWSEIMSGMDEIKERENPEKGKKDLQYLAYARGVSHLRMSRAALTLITALNAKRFNSILVGAVIGMAFALGLYTYPQKDDRVKMTKEFVTVDFPPDFASMEKALFFWSPKVSTRHAKACLDHLSYLGYCRVSHTHPLDSTDESRMDRQIATLRTVWEETSVPKDSISRDTLPNLLHGPLHGASMGGCVGLMYHWTRYGPCTKVISIRRSPMGDRFKPESITLAAYDAMSTHPALAAIMKGSMKQADDLRVWLDTVGETPWRTSSLSKYFCAEGLRVTNPGLVRFTKVMACLIAAATEEGLIAESFNSSYYVKNAKKSYSGGVSFWTSFFVGLTDFIKDMSLDDATAVFADAVTALEKPVALAVKDVPAV